jgi:hypothetical protein
MKKYWYRRYVYYCPPCGGEDWHKERVEGEKPKDPFDRIERITGMCNSCQWGMFGGI